MRNEHPMLAVRLDPDTYTAIRNFAAKNSAEHTLREIMQECIHQYLTAKGEGVNTTGEHHQVKLRSGRRCREHFLEDAIVIIDDEIAMEQRA